VYVSKKQRNGKKEMLLYKFVYCKSHQLNGPWQLKMMAACKKNETDEKMPTKRAELYEQYILTYNCATPPGTPVASNEREDEEECDE